MVLMVITILTVCQKMQMESLAMETLTGEDDDLTETA